MQDPRPIRYRSAKYLAWVRGKPCFGCGLPPPSEPHHVSIDGSAWGSKPSDLYTVPVCRKCHRRQEDAPWISKEELYRQVARLIEEWIRKGEK